MTSNHQGPSRSDGPSITNHHSQYPETTGSVGNSNNTNSLPYSTTIKINTQRSMHDYLQSKPPALSVSNKDSVQAHTPASTFKHVNPYKPHRRKQILKPNRAFAPTLQPRNTAPTPPQNAAPAEQPIATPVISAPLPEIPNPYTKKPNSTKQNLTKLALAHCESSGSDSSISTRSADLEIQELCEVDDISVRRSRSRLVYKPQRLSYAALGDSTPAPPPLLLPGIDHLSSSAQSAAISTLQDIIELQSSIRSCERKSQQLIEMLRNASETGSEMYRASTPQYSTSAPPMLEIHLDQQPDDTSQVSHQTHRVPMSIQNNTDSTEESVSTLTKNIHTELSVQTHITNPDFFSVWPIRKTYTILAKILLTY